MQIDNRHVARTETWEMCKIRTANLKKNNKVKYENWEKAGGGFSATKVVNFKTADLRNEADNVGSPRLGNIGTFIPSYSSSESVGQEC